MVNKKTQRHRFYEIVSIFRKYHVLSNLTHQTNAKDVCIAFEKLGPTFIKIGQILSTRTDMMRPDFAKILGNLQDNTTIDSFSEVKEIIESETGKKINEMYSSFNHKPFASASMGQAYNAVLKNNDKVVVKVQHPGIYKDIINDLNLFKKTLPWFHYVSDASVFDLNDMLSELKTSLLNELNTKLELKNGMRFYELNNNWDIIRVPKFYPRYSAQRVLVSEYMPGISMRKFLYNISNIEEKDQKLKIKCKYIANTLVRNFMKQVFHDGFFHADPHPGNILIYDLDNNSPQYSNETFLMFHDHLKVNKQIQLPPYRLVYLDFGMMGHLSKSLIKKIAQVLISINKQDIYQIGLSVLNICNPVGEVDEVSFCNELGQLLRPYFYMGIGEIDFGKMIYQMIDLCHQYNLQVDPDFTLLLKAFSTLEAIVGELDPQMSMMSVIKPFTKKYLFENLDKKDLVTKEAMKNFQFVNSSIQVPTKLLSILEELESGQTQLTLKVKNHSYLMNRIETLINRVVIAIVLAALIIGSSLMADVSPGHFISKLGIIGYLVAIIIILWLTISDYRKKHKNKK